MYESYYGLNSKPFQLTPDPEFFFASKLHKRAMSYLQYGLSQAEGFIVITGDIGTGKTTIANSLLNDIEADIYAAQIVTPKLSPDEIVKMVAAKFGIDTSGKTKTDLLQALQHFLEQLASNGKRALLLVDEAQNLPLETIEELRMLSNFQHKGKPLLQSFLLGQAELQPILRAPNMEQFRQRIVASCHLAPLNFDETCAYINYRLDHAGCKRTDLFSDDAYKAIHKFTTGVPRKSKYAYGQGVVVWVLEEINTFSVVDVNQVIQEVQAEMFIPEEDEQEMDVQRVSKSVEPTAATPAPAPKVPEVKYVYSGDAKPRQDVEAHAEQVIQNDVVQQNQAPQTHGSDVNAEQTQNAHASGASERPVHITKNGNVVQEAQYYKDMLEELVDALDDAIKNKVKLTQYIDKLLKKKYQTYVRMKNDDVK